MSNTNRRGASSGRGAKSRREGLAPLPSTQPRVPAIESLDEICAWLGAFRERLKIARAEDRVVVAAMVHELEARYQLRRAELS